MMQDGLGTAKMTIRRAFGRATRRRAAVAVLALVAGVLLPFALPATTARAATDPCGSSGNPIACENTLPGTPQSQWWVAEGGPETIQGFTTDISVNHGSTVHFKVSTVATGYRIDIYRMGYYGGNGARLITSISPSATLPQSQPNCLFDSTTRLVDCGNWSESASWAIPSTAVSGVYFANLVRTDGVTDVGQVFFIVRADESHSALLYQTSDTTWQAYNRYGGYSLYYGSPMRAYKVSYNRPFITRDCCDESFVFSAEYPMIRWIEANGYDVSYISGLDTDRSGSTLLNHKTFMSSGHDEYWSAGQRANVESARAAGVNLAFFSGNETFWKTRWEPSIADSTANRTLVTYKETYANAKIDPNPAWTGTWRDPRFSPPSDGGRPENSMTGTLYTVNCCSSSAEQNFAITVPYPYSQDRLWRNTSIAGLSAGSVATLSAETLGYEWDEDVDNGQRPPGLIDLSSTTESVSQHLIDYGNTYTAGTATNHLTLYRSSSGALVFGAGTIRWSWGLDATHELPTSVVDPRMQQATVNLLADMGAQPVTLQPGLVAAAPSTDTTAPTASVSSPASGTQAIADNPTTISGIAADSGGGVVAGVEISTDGGTTWHPATGTTNWSYTWTPSLVGTTSIVARAIDDSGNIGTQTPAVSVTVVRRCPCSVWNTQPTPSVTASTDATANELGVKFQSSVPGYVSSIEFYKGSTNTGTHVGHIWSKAGTLLGSVTFTNETTSGWQKATFSSPISIAANTTYIASYYAPSGHYAVDQNYFATSGVNSSPLSGLQNGTDGSNGVYRQGSSAFPNSSYKSSNYWVDVVFNSAPPTAPANLVATAGSPSSINLSWQDTATESAYRVERSPDGSTGWTAVATLGQNVLSYSDTNLLPATTYYYRVVAENPGGDSPPSLTAAATTLSQPPSTPSGLSATPVLASQINLSWTAVPSETGYRLERSADGSTWSPLATTTNTSYSDTGLAASTTYYYRVSAFNNGGNSAASAAVPATTLAAVAPPPAPTGLTAVTTSTQASLTWSDVPGETGFLVQRSADGTSWITVNTTDTGETSYVDASDISPSTLYYYQVIATNAGGNSPPSNVVAATTKPVAPLAPTGVTATVVSASRIDVGWSAVSGATGYRVERSPNGTSGWAAVGTTTTATTLSDTTVLSGSTYYYRLFATNSGGDSTPSATVAATTPVVVPTAPTGLTASTVSSAEIDLSWTAPWGATSYTVQRSLDGSTGWTTVGTPSTASFADTILSPATKYYYRVSASNSAGTSANSTTVSGTTTTTPPVNLTASTVSAGEVDLSWSATAGATGYQVERSPDGSTAWAVIGSPTAASWADTTVFSGATYYYRVSARDAGGLSAVSATASATVTPAAPTGLAAAAISQSEIDLSWNATNGAASYTVQRSADGSTGWTTVGTASGLSYADTTLLPMTTYYYRVLAGNAGGTSTPSAVASATTSSPLQVAAPTGVSASAVSQTEVDLTWTGSSGATGYRVERSPDGSTGWTAVGTPTGTSFADTTVGAATTYYYRVFATSAGGDSPPSTVVSATTPPNPPGSPTALAATTASQSEIDLSWTGSTGATGYTVQRSPDGSTGWTTIGTPTGTSYADTGLSPATRYYYQVIATNSGGNSAPSSSSSATTTTAAPTGLAATAVSTGEIDLSWAATTGATGYTVQRSADGSTGWTTIGTPTSPSWADTTVSAGSTYYYRVAAGDAGGLSAWSSAALTTVAPAAPGGLTATTISQSEIDLSWTAANGATGYTVQRSADGSTGWTTIGSPTGTSYADTNLTSSTTYYYRVLAGNSGGTSTASGTASATTTSGAPSQPTGLQVTSATATEVDLAWTDAAGETGYRIERSPDGSTGWTAIGTTSANVTTFADTTVGPSTTYYYRVFATNSGGDSAPSTVVPATTPPLPPAAPTGLTATTASQTEIDLSWTAATGATGYTLQRSPDGSTGWTTIATPTTTSYANTALSAGTTYYYRVLATNSGGSSPASSTASATTLPAPPATPGNLVAAAASSSEIDLRWSTSATATSYRIDVSANGSTGWTTLINVAAPTTTYAHLSLTPSTTYFYRVVASNSGGSSSPSATASATTVTRSCPCSVWTSSSTPKTAASGDTSSNELGVKFQTNVSGTVSGVRFYKGSTNTGTHVGHLWSRTGTLLATATFTNETASGWQQVLFSTPVAVTANTTYIASYYAPSGHYAADLSYFATAGVTNLPVTLLAAGVDGANGVYHQGTSAFPGSTYSSTNYWVDVVFTPAVPAAPTGLTVGTVTANSIALSWTPAAGATSYRVERSPDGVSNWALVGSTTTSTSFTDVALAAGASYYYRVFGVNGGGTSPPSTVVSATTPPS